MPIDRVRHGRQIRLVEIGEAGQQRLSSSEVCLRASGEAREVEAAYLEGAGLRVRVRVTENADRLATPTTSAAGDDATVDAKVFATTLASLGVRDRAASDVARGALFALLAMRRVLGIATEGSSS